MAISYYFYARFLTLKSATIIPLSKNFELADDSVVEMLRAVTIKESLTKSEVINPISVLTKEKRD